LSARKSLNGIEFADMVRAGHRCLLSHVNIVNALNVFPVPDGDTGTNMELSLASGVRSIEQTEDVSLFRITQALCSGLLMGARGNSGVILSQLFRGFLKVSQKSALIDVNLFAQALQEGVQVAYGAVAKPVEGTVLSVAREAAAEGLREAKHQTEITEWLRRVHCAAQKALLRTPDQLPVLKQAGVVDSGGQGLVYILEGFLHYVLTGDVNIDSSDTQEQLNPVSSDTVIEFAAAHVKHEGEFGYCTEVLIELKDFNNDLAQAQLRTKLLSYGDSLVVVGVDKLLKVHVHTVHPGRVLEDTIEYGPLIKIKIDNMTAQHDDIVQSDAQNRRTALSVKSSTKRISVVAVVSGRGLSDIFSSLGVDVVLSGGQTMNPSTEEIVEAIRNTESDYVLLLPNNKNIVMSAEQASLLVSERDVKVVHTTSIPQGIAAMMTFSSARSISDNAELMEAAMVDVSSGMVVRAVRDSTFQNRDIRANQFLGLLNQDLVVVADDVVKAATQVVSALGGNQAELLTLFYGAECDEHSAQLLANQLQAEFELEVEVQYGGQPVCDYIFSLE